MGNDVTARVATLSMLEAIPAAAILIGHSQHILSANSKANELLGEGIEGLHFITVLRQPAILDAIESTLSEKTPHNARYLDSKQSIDQTFVVRCSYVYAELGAGVMVCFEDITHLQKAEQVRRDFVANVSHELRTPLTAMIGFIETLLGPARNDTEARERFLGIMQTEAARMERLVKDLLSLSRLEEQQRARPTGKLNITQILNSVLATMQPLAVDQNVELVFSSPEPDVYVQGDADQLRQVFTNLIENAIKYGGTGKPVDIGMCVVDHEPLLRVPAVHISICDHGNGIAAHHIPRLTERFYRVDTHRSREMGGTGLGLAIVKHILNRHRGRLRIKSDENKGSEFKVLLPVLSPSVNL